MKTGHRTQDTGNQDLILSDVKAENLPELAQNLHNIAVKGITVSALALAAIQENILYYSLGFETMEEYVETMLPYSYRTVQDYIRIGRNLMMFFPNFWENNNLLNTASSNTFNEAQHVASKTARLINQLGHRKLLILTKLPEHVFNDLMRGGVCITFPEPGELTGRELTLEDLCGMTEREIRDALFRAPSVNPVKVPVRVHPINEIKSRYFRDVVTSAKLVRIGYTGILNGIEEYGLGHLPVVQELKSIHERAMQLEQETEIVLAKLEKEGYTHE